MAGYLVCVAKGYFADDVRAHCAMCFASIEHRPHVDPVLVKICTACAAHVLNTHPDAQIGVTEQSLVEAALYFVNTKGAH